MHSRAKPPTKSERERMASIVDIGCVACRLWNGPIMRPAEVHHLLDGGVRRGHEATICLCGWHHRGVVPWVNFQPISVAEATDRFGPSLYHDAKSFRHYFGYDDHLLAYQNQLIAEARPRRGEE